MQLMDGMTHYFAYCLTSLPLLSNRTHCDSIPLVFGAVDIDGKSRKIRSSGPKKSFDNVLKLHVGPAIIVFKK